MNEPIALGFDIGGSKTKIGLVNGYGEVLAYNDFPTEVQAASLDSFVQKLFEEIQALLDLVDGKVIGIGATFLGWIDDARTGPFLCMNVPALHGINLRGLLDAEFHLPVVLIDDINAHTLAEYTYGSGQGYRRFMCLAMGTGLSAGVIIHGKPLQFTGGCAGDTGHVILRPGGPICSAGCKGCAEALIGVAGIERQGLEKYGSYKPAYEIIKNAREGNDPIAIDIMRQIGLFTGELLASLSHIFLPERISLTGGIAKAGKVLLDATNEQFEQLVGDYHRLYSKFSGGYYSGVDIVSSKLEDRTGLIGAVVQLFNP